MGTWKVFMFLAILAESLQYSQQSITINGICISLQATKSLLELFKDFPTCNNPDPSHITISYNQDTQDFIITSASIKLSLSQNNIRKFIIEQIPSLTRTGRALSNCFKDIKYCVDCDQNNKCTESYPGYYISEDSSIEQCTVGCKTCTSNTTCDECFDGFVMNEGTCVHCPGDCLVCESKSKCLICKPQFYVLDDLCAPCMAGCKYCKNSTDCGECYSGYYLNTLSQCIGCQTGCYSCTGTKCSLAYSGYFLLNSYAFPCPDNCFECSSGTVCKYCEASFYVNEYSLCSPCPTGCLSCTSNEICIQCQSSYYLTNKELCSPCPASCHSCQNSYYCDTCNDGHYKDPTKNSCLKCAAGCYDCDKDKCTQCFPSYILNPPNKCENCGTGLEQCQTYGTVCLDGFYLHNEICNTCPAGCKTCNAYKSCTSCLEGLYLNQSVCTRLPSWCSNFDENGKCTVCQLGFYYNQGSCEQCSKGCEICEEFNKCLVCRHKFYLSGETCEACPSGFESCLNSTFGVKCGDSYFMYNHLCLSCSNGCKSCIDYETCVECLEGFYLADDSCYECEFGCGSCNSTTCFSCLSQYFMSTDSKCYDCPENCQSCFNQSVCSECSQGYFVDSHHSCVKCPENCQTCTANFCLECLEGFFINNKSLCEYCKGGSCKCEPGFYYSEDYSCKSCPLQCETCSNSSLCQSCAGGFYLSSEGECVDCDRVGCEICDDVGCKLCKTGFFIDSGSCFICGRNCKACESFSVCVECEESWELVDESYCLPCPQNCITCQNLICQECYPGFILQDSECTSPIPNCLIPTSTTCQYCQNGYTELQNSCANCSPISIQDAKFDEYFNSITFTFNRPIDNKEAQDCSQCKLTIATDDDMGQDCKCYGEGFNYIVEFSQSYFLTINSLFTIRSEMLFEYVCDPAELLLMTKLRYVVQPKEPVFSIRGTKRKSSLCEDEYLFYDVVEIENSYGFDMAFSWSAFTEPSNQLAEVYVFGGWGSGIVVPVELFGNVSTKIVIQVTAENIVKLSGHAEFTSWVYNSQMISVEIDSPETKTIRPDRSYIITGIVTDPCYKSSVRKKWTSNQVDMTQFKQPNSHLLYIGPYSIEPLTTVGFNFTADSGNLFGFTELFVRVEYAPLELVIDIVNASVSVEHDLSISAEGSYDPNNEDGSADGLTAYWEVCYLSNSDECIPSTVFNVSDSLIFTKEQKSLPKTGTKWGIIVTLSSKNSAIPTTSKSFFITFSNNLSSQISLYLKDYKHELSSQGLLLKSFISLLNPANTLSLIWDLPSTLSTTVIGTSLPYLFIKPFTSSSRLEYKLTLRTYQSSIPDSYSFILFTNNQKPICAEGLTTYPESSGYAMETYFSISINSCTDTDTDFPLTFRISIKYCSVNCTGSPTDTYTPYIQISIKNHFAYRVCKLPEGTVVASAQVCDYLKGCNHYKKTITVNASKKSITSGFIDKYYVDIIDAELVPYYSVIYISVYELNLNEYQHIYNKFYSYLKKQEIINSDVVHILLTFVNQMFNKDNKFLTSKMIVNYLSNVKTIVARHSDSINDQNVWVAGQIFYNVINSGTDIVGDPQLINVALDFILYLFAQYAIDHLPGDLIINIQNWVEGFNGFEYYKYRDLGKNIVKGVRQELSHVLLGVYEVDADEGQIVNVDLFNIVKIDGQSIVFIRLSQSGWYNETSFEFEFGKETEIGILENSLKMEVMNGIEDRVCLRFDGKVWVDSFCEIDSGYDSNTSSRIIVSTSALYRIEDKNVYYQTEKITYSPLIISCILSATPMAFFLIVRFYNKKKKVNQRISKQKQGKPTTLELIVKYTLVLSVFSKDPEIQKSSQILHFCFILNLQLVIEGLFISHNIIQDTTLAEIVGVAFISPLLTIPFNIIATFHINPSNRCYYTTFLSTYTSLLFLCSLSVILINILITKGKNASWIYSFTIGLSCELITEFLIMFLKNLKLAQKHKNKH